MVYRLHQGRIVFRGSPQQYWQAQAERYNNGLNANAVQPCTSLSDIPEASVGEQDLMDKGEGDMDLDVDLDDAEPQALFGVAGDKAAVRGGVAGGGAISVTCPTSTASPVGLPHQKHLRRQVWSI